MYPEILGERPLKWGAIFGVKYRMFRDLSYLAASSIHTSSRKAFDLRPAERIASSLIAIMTTFLSTFCFWHRFIQQIYEMTSKWRRWKLNHRFFLNTHFHLRLSTSGYQPFFTILSDEEMFFSTLKDWLLYNIYKYIIYI